MGAKDRLPELAQRAAVRSAAGRTSRVYRDTVEPAPAPTPTAPPLAEHQKEIETIFEEVERMRGWIAELTYNTQLLRRLHADPTYHTNKHIQDQLDSVVTQSNAIGLKVCGALREFECRVRLESDVRARIARLQYAVTRRLYADALEQYHAALHVVRDDQMQLLQRQVKLLNLTISDDECQSLLDSNNISLFVDNVQAETADARRALRDVEARHEDLLRIETSLQEVRDLFRQLAYLVLQQQEQVDSVEYYALQTAEHVEKGGQQLLKGTVSRTKARKKKMALIVCLVCGFLLVVIILIFT